MQGILLGAANNALSEEQQRTFDDLDQRQKDLDGMVRRYEQMDALDAELRQSLGDGLAATWDGTPAVPGAPFTGGGFAGGELVADGRGLGGSPERAALLGYRPAGAAVISATEASLRMQEQWGEGLFGTKQFAATNTMEYRQAFRHYLRGGLTALSGAELRTLTEGSDPAGGYLVPPDITSRVLMKEPAPTRVSGRVTVFPTGRDRMTLPRMIYATDDIWTSGMRLTWTGEQPANGAAHRVTDPVFDQIVVDVHTAMMSLLLSRDLVEDSAVPLISLITSKFQETIDLARDQVTLVGTGTNQPHGILEAPGTVGEPAVIPGGQASTIDAASLQAINWQLPEQYEDAAAWYFNKASTGRAIGTLTDTAGRYFWQPYELSGLVGGRRSDLLGYPVVLSAFMPSVAANAFPIIFGDLGGYVRVDRVGLSVEVLRERYAEENQILILGRIRFGGDVAEPYRMRVLKVSVT
jgi:HK97 family phage major capsid protein